MNTKTYREWVVDAGWLYIQPVRDRGFYTAVKLR